MSEQTAESQVLTAPDERAPYEPPHEDEGHSIAAWIGVALILIGIATVAACLFFDVWVGVWVGAGITVLGIILWPILKAAGLGPKTR